MITLTAQRSPTPFAETIYTTLAPEGAMSVGLARRNTAQVSSSGIPS